ncbi:MAG: hypothetical protein LBK04_06325 [Clostridiales Family XIII bacterium]|jgi:hypothetical protein|nr:hypothetical protein [Clostridiales Family XIII bacterium]
MKKRLLLVLTMVVVAATLMMPIVASAATEADIISALKAGIKVGDQVKAIPADYIAAAQKYLDNNVVSSEQAQKAIDAIDSVGPAWEAIGVEYFEQMSSDEKASLVKIATGAAEAVGAKLTWNGDKGVVVTDPAGNVYTVGPDGFVIKQTGYSYAVPAAVAGGLVLLLVAAFAVTSKKRLLSDAA